MTYFDIVFVADPRFPGGTSTAVASEIRAASGHGYRCGLLALKGPVLGKAHRYHPAIRDVLVEGLASWIDPESACEAILTLMHHPQIATHLPVRPIKLRSEQRLVIVQHPPFDGAGSPYYPSMQIAHNADALLAGPTQWAPVGPLCRQQFRHLVDGPILTEQDWPSIIDPHFYERPHLPPKGPNLIIGRHSRPDTQKWPGSREDVLKAYPDRQPFDVRILGGGDFLDTLMANSIPKNWQVLPFQPTGVVEFLQSLDVYVYYHHPHWVEAFGRTLVEAMAAGVPLVVEPHFEPLLGDGALYAELDDAADKAFEVASNHQQWQHMQDAGRAKVAEQFSPAALGRRLHNLIGPPKPAHKPISSQKGNQSSVARPRALFVTSNGIGLGHLTRAMAVAKRLPQEIEPVFATMSQAAKLIEDAGIACHFVPFHKYLEVDNQRWNAFLRLEMLELIKLLEPRAVIFDGNMPYGGLIDAMHDYPSAWRIWIRRAMWRKSRASEIAIKREDRFDVVIEPGDFAQAFDRGPTAMSSARVLAVDPIRLVEHAEMLSGHEARDQLDLPRSGQAILVQLGSGNNYDYRQAVAIITSFADSHPDTHFVFVESPISDEPLDLEKPLLNRSCYPLARFFNAFDAAISATGYNSYHELLSAGLPTLFVPNENPSMDDQGRRARIAARHGWAGVADAADPYALSRGIQNLLDPNWRSQARERMKTIETSNGAVEAALIVQEAMMTMRADID